MSLSPEIDATSLAPRDRHSAIFRAFDALSPGGALVLVNDHDPTPLRFQFSYKRPEAYLWETLENGPQVWKVRISRRR